VLEQALIGSGFRVSRRKKTFRLQITPLNLLEAEKKPKCGDTPARWKKKQAKGHQEVSQQDAADQLLLGDSD
jgi:hypothetical protein